MLSVSVSALVDVEMLKRKRFAVKLRWNCTEGGAWCA
jgi:hypothetical protein